MCRKKTATHIGVSGALLNRKKFNFGRDLCQRLKWRIQFLLEIEFQSLCDFKVPEISEWKRMNFMYTLIDIQQVLSLIRYMWLNALKTVISFQFFEFNYFQFIVRNLAPWTKCDTKILCRPNDACLCCAIQIQIII